MSALIRWFFLNLYTVFCTDCTDKGGGGGRVEERVLIGPCHTSLIKSKNIPSVDNKNTCQFGFLTFYVYVNLQ